MDFSGDLYGEAARVSFVTHLREERRFDSTEALVRQMNADVAAARAALGLDRPPVVALTAPHLDFCPVARGRARRRARGRLRNGPARVRSQPGRRPGRILAGADVASPDRP